MVSVELSNRKQRTKINQSYSFWESILFGVLQGFILVTLLSSIFICNLFTIIDISIANYAGDNTPFVSGDTPLHLMVMGVVACPSNPGTL